MSNEINLSYVNLPLSNNNIKSIYIINSFDYLIINIKIF